MKRRDSGATALRIPLLKPWRAFEQLDELSDAECQAVIRDALLNAPPWLDRVPWILCGHVAAAWGAGWAIADGYFPLHRYVPIPSDPALAIIQLAVTTVIAGALVWFLARDAMLYWCIRRYLARASCPKCHQPLHGLPVQSIGAEPDPANQFVRCPECGKKIRLLEVGLTPRDLIPLEQRRVDPSFGGKRVASPGTRRSGAEAD